jgi:hypothetical protein
MLASTVRNKHIALYVFALSGFDALATFVMVSGGYAKEVNPFMASLISASWLTFAFVKMLLTGIGCYALCRMAGRKALVLVAAIYSLMTIYHLTGMRLVGL